MKQRVAIPPSLSSQGPALSNARLGMLLFVAAEVMLFAGLLAGYVVLRFGSGNFEGMERLPIGLTALSTSLLVASSIALIVASKAVKRGAMPLFKMAALATLFLGAGFLAVQVVEWRELMAAGISPAINIYGGMFYILSWVHGAHVAGGIILLAVLAVLALMNRITSTRRTIVAATAIYWHFVTIVWITLFMVLFVV